MKIIMYLRKDWTFIPMAAFLLSGYFWSFFDYNSLQKQAFPQFWVVLGFFLLIIGGIIELMVRLELMDKAKFPSLNSTKLLQIVKGHLLITDGMFKYIRHPLYVGRILLSFGIGLIGSSVYGLVLIAIGIMFTPFRIQIEEKMLLNEFGDAYRAYQKTTKKLIPYLY